MRWITRGLLAVALALGVVVPTTAPGASAATELIQNGTFASGTTNWWGSGNTPISVDAGQLKAVVPGGTAQKWDAMLGQKVPAFPIHKNHRYVLSFDARASAAREVRTTVQLNADPYTPNLDKLFTIGITTKRYAFAFTATQEITASELTFQMGGVAGYTLWLDNVSLVDNYGNVAGNPLSMTSGFYVDPDNNAKLWANKPENANHQDRQLIIDNIATKPMARWFGGWSGDIADAVHRFVRDADAADKLPTLVAYNVPGRDACGGHSSGGAQAVAAWCNPADRKLGVTSQVGGGAEMLLWIKVPGDSDGRCGIKEVDAGTFDPYLAKSLILGDSTP